MENRQPVHKPTEDFITITDLWHLCLAHWNWFVVSLFICIGGASYYLAVTPNQYTREAAILVKQDKQNNTTKNSDNEVLNDVSVVQQQTNVPNVQRQLVSLEVLSEVARRLKMANTDASCLKQAQGLSKRLKVKVEDDKASIINLSIIDTSPVMAEKILSTTVQVFNEKWLADKNRISATTSAFIQDRLHLLERELGGVDDSISSFKARNKITDIDRISDIYLQQQSNSDAQILTLSNQKSMAVYIIGLLRDRDSQHQLLPTNSGINNSVAEAQITQYNNLLLQLKSSMYNTSSQNPLIIKQEAELSDIRKNIVATINNHIKALDIQLQSYMNVSGEANSKITKNPQHAKHLLSVEREQKVKESLYLYLLQKKEENEISTTYTSYITEMIDPPHGSEDPTAPNSRNVLFAAILMALLIPTVILFIRENMDNTVRDKFDIERKSNLTLIGEVPLYRYDRIKKKAVAAPKFKVATLSDIFSLHKKEEKNNPLVVQPDKQDIVNEAFRVIRTNLEFMTSKQGEKNVYIVTSSYEGSGKTFVSMNLALALAIKGKRVLLVDGDLRHASASHHLHCPKIGFADYLAGKEDDFDRLIVSASDTLESFLHERADEVSSLHILPVGTVPPNPTELLASERLEQLISVMRPQYDFIIIDCPPAESLADTGIIERHADRTLFVLRAGLFERKRIEDLEADAQNGKFKHMSVILNGAKFGGRYGNRYGYRYSYQYRYGYHNNYRYGADDENSGLLTDRMRLILFFVISLILCVGIYKVMKSVLSPKEAPQNTVMVADTIIQQKPDTTNVIPQSQQPEAKDSAKSEPIVQDLVEKPAPEPVAKPTVKPEAKPLAKAEVKPKPADTHYYTIVMSCFQNAESAKTAVADLSKQGLKDCFTHTSSKLTRVVYSRFKTNEEAIAKLRTLRTTNPLFKDSWVLEVL